MSISVKAEIEYFGLAAEPVAVFEGKYFIITIWKDLF